MIVSIEGGRVSLAELDDLKGFKATAPAAATEAEIAAALDGAGRLEGGHAWISEAWLRQQAAGRDEAWFASFGRVLDYARSKGWYDDATASVRAHVERV